MRTLRKMGKMMGLGVELTVEQMKMVETLAREKYKCPQSKSHAMRMMIEDVYYEWEIKEALKEIERDGKTT